MLGKVKSRHASGSIEPANKKNERPPSAAWVVAAAVCTLSCDVADPPPGVMEGGEKLAVVPGAGSPLAASVTALGKKLPFCAAAGDGEGGYPYPLLWSAHRSMRVRW